MPDRQLDFGPGSEAPAAKAEFASAVMRRERPTSPGRTCLIQILEELHLQILEELTVIASEAKQSILSLRLYGLLRGACHRARIRATRWLAMTAIADVRSQSRGAMRPSCA